MNQILPTGASVTLVHFTYSIGDGQWRIACMPNMTEFHKTPYHPAYMRSSSLRGVTCPMCLKSQKVKTHA